MLSINKLVRNFYFHIPFCLKKCYFCAFPVHALGDSTPDHVKSLAYEQYMEKMQEEVQILLKKQQICQSVESIYFGGGTPSLLDPNNIQPILNYLSKKIKSSTEITLQMNPQQIPKAQQFISIGINRLSIGIQTLSPAVNKSMNRSEIGLSLQDLIQKLIKIKSRAILNLDIIINLNESNQINKLLFLIQQVMPHHLSCYILQINQGSYLFRNTEKYKIYIDNYDNYEMISKKLQILGYDHYEVSNFCLKGFESCHNNAYWKGNKSFAGFGMGSTSFLNNIRVTKPKNLSKYYKYVNQIKKNQAEVQLNKYDSIIEFLQIHSEQNQKQSLKWVILSRLRKKQGIQWNQIREKLLFAKQTKEKVESKIQDCKKMLIELNESRKLVDEKGLDLGVKALRPQGYLFVDQIGYRIIDILKI